MIFKFRALNDENDNFLRDYEIPYDMTLLDFHNYICSDLRYDAQSGASFFLSDTLWTKGQEFTLFEMDEESDQGPIPMEKVTLGQIIHKNKDRLIYVFDLFGDRALFMELISTLPQQQEVSYPVTSLSEEEPPHQFDPSLSEGSMFDDIFEEFGDFEGEESYDDEF